MPHTSTTRIPLGGMDYSTKPHMLPKEKARLMHNMRVNGTYIEQVRHKKQQFEYDASANGLLHMSYLPCDIANYGVLVGLTKDRVLQLRPESTKTVYEHNVKFVLTWGATPKDLDLHLITPYISGTQYEIWYSALNLGSLTEVPYAHLDTDDTDGYGPEQIQVAQFYPGMYQVFVHNYQDIQGDTGPLANCGAQVKIYVDDVLTETIDVPTTGSGLYWDVGYVNGSTGEVTVVNEIVSTKPTGDPTATYPTEISSIALRYNSGGITSLTTDSRFRRFGTCVHNNHLFFVNELNPVMMTEGTHVRKLATSGIPKGRYVAVFFDHVVVGAPIYNSVKKPWEIMWSDLHDYSNWTPGSDSEADSYICTEMQTGEEKVAGITGMINHKHMLLIFTERAVYAMRYVGLPRVVRVEPVILGFGNGLPYAVGTIDDKVAFIDTNHRQFYMIDVARSFQPQAFGDPIVDYFFDDLSTTYDYSTRTYFYRDFEKNEAVWTYVSKASTTGAYDKAVAYNFSNNTWTVRDAVGEMCYLDAGYRARCADESYEYASAREGTVTASTAADDSVLTLENFGRVWGSKLAEVLDDDTYYTAEANIRGMSLPVIETGDLLFDAPREVKEVSDVVLSATAASFRGVKVEVSARKMVDSPVTFTEVGIWEPTIAQEKLTFAPKSGKVLRYRFTGVPASGKTQVRDLEMSIIDDNVNNVKASR